MRIRAMIVHHSVYCKSVLDARADENLLNTFKLLCMCVLSAFRMPLNLFSTDLSEPVDVYSDWIDACEAANQ